MDDTATDFALGDEAEQSIVDRSALLCCLRYIARHQNLPFSSRAIVEGLPINAAGDIPPEILPRAAARLGLKARLFERVPSTVPSILLPCIVLLGNGDAAVLVSYSRRRRKAKIVFPQVSDAQVTVASQQLNADSAGFVFYLVDDSREESGTEEKPSRQSKRGHWFWGPMLRIWPSWLQIAVAAFAINVLGLATPIFVMNVYDRVIPNLAIPTLWALSAGVVIALVFEITLRQLRTVVLDQAGQRIDMKVSAELFEHAVGISMGERHEATGALANRVRDFDNVKDFFASASIVAIVDFAFIAIFIAILWLIVGPLAFVALAAVPLVIVVTLLVQIPLSRSVYDTQRKSSVRQAVLVESLGAIETVGAEGVLQNRWEDVVAANARDASRVRYCAGFSDAPMSVR